MVFLSTVYTQIICAVILFFTKLHPIALLVFACLYYGAGSIHNSISRMPSFERPQLYNISATNNVLAVADISALVLTIILVIVNWKMFLLSLAITVLLGRKVLALGAEVLIVWPVYFFASRKS